MKSIAVGKKHTLLLASGGQVYAIGKNRAGCLGNISLSLFVCVCGLCSPFPPLPASGLSKGQKKLVWDAVLVDALAGVRIEFVAAGDKHSVAVSESGAIYAFGSDTRDPARPLEGTTSVKPVQVAVGHNHTLLLLPVPLLLPESKKGGSAEGTHRALLATLNRTS
jgi:hypothetical protein